MRKIRVLYNILIILYNKMGNAGSSSFSGTRKVSHRHTRGRSARSNNNNINNNTEGVKEDVLDAKKPSQATSISATNNRARRASSYVAPSNRTRKVRKNARGGGGRKVVEEVKPRYEPPAAVDEEDEEFDDSI